MRRPELLENECEFDVKWFKKRKQHADFNSRREMAVIQKNVA